MQKLSCKYCDTSLRIRKFTPGFEYTCPKCDGVVYRSGASIPIIVTMSLSTLVIFFWMINSTMLTVTVFDSKSRTVLDSIIILYEHNFPLSTAILFTTVIAIPIIMILLINFIIFGSKFGVSKKGLTRAISFYDTIKEWNMTEVYLIGVLISMIKLDELTKLETNIGLWINFLYIIMFYITVTFFNPHDIADTVDVKKKDPNSIFKASLYLFLAIIFIIPSNVLPIMPSYKFGVEYDNTIIAGVFQFIKDKDYFVAFVIFFTSFCIPLLKIIGVFVMILMAKYGVLLNYRKAMTVYYRVTDGWGKYSMLDVFVVVIVASFIQYNQLVRVETGTAIMPFTLVVFFTMMASKSFDTRLIWEKK